MSLSRWFGRAALWLPLLAVAALAAAANVWVVNHPQRLDLTSAGVYTIGPQTQRALESLREPVTITFFYDLRSRSMADSRALLEQYAARSPYVTVRALDPVLVPAEARRQRVQFAGTAVFESRKRRVLAHGGSEADFTNGLLRATASGGQTLCFTDGHVEADPYSLKTHDHFEGAMGHGHSHSSGGRTLELHERHGMGMARDALETLGYAVRPATLAKGPAQLEGCSVTVIAGPQRRFEQFEVTELRAWAARGGRLIAMVDPFVASGLDPLFADFGLRVEASLVHDERSHYWTDPATPAVSNYPRHRITRNLPLTFFPGAAAIVPRRPAPGAEVRVTPLVQTSDDSRAVPIRREGITPAKGMQTLAVLATKKLAGDALGRPAELFLASDADFATNSFFHIFGNGALFLNAVSYLAERDQLLDIVPRNYELPTVQLTNQQMRFTFIVSTVVLPLLALALAVLAWWRRR